MSCVVRWHESAVENLATILGRVAPEDHGKVIRALRQIDLDLRNDPWVLGESRPHRTRVYFVPPIGVRFQVDRGSKVAVVVGVWGFRMRNGNGPQFR